MGRIVTRINPTRAFDESAIRNFGGEKRREFQRSEIGIELVLGAQRAVLCRLLAAVTRKSGTGNFENRIAGDDAYPRRGSCGF